MRTELKIMIPIAVVVIAIGGYFVFKSGSSTPAAPLPAADQSKLVHANSYMTGNINAKVTLVEFGDYECPSCGAAYQPIKDIVNQYSSNPNFNFVFRNFPLSTVHPNADISAEAAEAAGEQGKYWQMHDLLYENQGTWGDSASPMQYFLKYAQQLGLNVATFQTEVTAGKFEPVIQADVADGNAVGINATPTFFVNGVPIVGDQQSDITSAIAKDLAAAPSSTPAPTPTPAPSATPSASK
jgi:protein-disulfide isomerase